MSIQGFQRIRSQIIQRVATPLQSGWADWWKRVGGVNATNLTDLKECARVMHDAPSDLGFGFVFGVWCIRFGESDTLESLPADMQSIGLSLVRRSTNAWDEVAENHSDFDWTPVPEFGDDYEAWLAMAPNDFTRGYIAGLFSAQDHATRERLRDAPQEALGQPSASDD